MATIAELRQQDPSLKVITRPDGSQFVDMLVGGDQRETIPVTDTAPSIQPPPPPPSSPAPRPSSSPSRSSGSSTPTRAAQTITQTISSGLTDSSQPGSIPAVTERADELQREIFDFAKEQANIQNAFVREALDAQLRISDRALDIQETQLGIEQERFAREETQFRLMQDLAPQLMSAFGINANRDAQGNITGFTVDQTSLSDPTITNMMEIYTQKAADAAQGKIPPLAERLFAEEEQQLHEAARRNLGPGYETSTPFLEAMNLFERDKSLRLSEINRAEVATFGQLASQAAISQENLRLGKAGAAMGFLSPQTATVASIPGLSQVNIPKVPGVAGIVGASADVFGNQADILRSRVAALSPIAVANISRAGAFDRAFLDSQTRLALGQLASQTDISVANIGADARIRSVQEGQSDPFGQIVGGILGGVFGEIF